MPGEATELLNRIREGDEQALSDLLTLLYGELRRLAGHLLRQERAGHTLQPTALVHEAYIALLGQEQANWHNKAQFLALAAQTMRRILLHYARRRRAAKRTAPAEASVIDLAHESGVSWEEVLAVDQALCRLAEFDAQQARIAELRYFGGLSVEEIAEALNVSPRTVKRDWAAAKGWLHMELTGAPIE